MDIEAILEENKQLKVLVEELQDKLKKYTNPVAHQVFYEKNKEKIIKESSERLKKLKETNPDKLKEYRRNAYLKRKEKLWSITPKTGILKIKNNKNDEWLKRLDILKETIEYWSNPENKTEKTIEVIQLFYTF